MGRITRLYRIWQLMKNRCRNPKSNDFKSYGAKGIDFIDEWVHFKPFQEWSMKNGYDETLTIDRIDNSKGYSKENCRWTTRNVQARNTRKIMSTNTSGVRGAFFKADGIRKKRWGAKIRVCNKDIYLGVHHTAKEAGQAYDKYVIDNNLEHTKNQEV